MATERNRSSLGASLVLWLFIASVGSVSAAWSCSCGGSTAEGTYRDADAVLKGRVTAISQGYLRAAWCQVRALFGSELSNYETACGVRVTVEVEGYWKGVSASTIRLATGRGGGDCGVRFTKGERYLLYLSKTPSDLFETNICMRPQPLDQAAEDLAVLGPAVATGTSK